MVGTAGRSPFCVTYLLEYVTGKVKHHSVTHLAELEKLKNANISPLISQDYLEFP